MNRGARRDGRGHSPSAMMGPRARSASNSQDEAGAADARRKLEALFGGGTAPALRGGPGQSERQNAFASPRKQMGYKPSEHSMRLSRLRIAHEVKDIQEAADAFLAHHQLPDDMGILVKLLQHESERVLCDVMGQISSLLHQRRARSTIILTDRLKEISQRHLSQGTQSCLDGLRNQIALLSS